MALDATLGGLTTNSYTTLVLADAYFADRSHSSAWDALDDPAKSNALVTASLMLDWYLKWKGVKTTSTQSMQWPRTGALRPDGTEIDDDVLPPEIVVAVCELALSSIIADRTLDNPMGGFEQVKVGSLMVKADNGDSDSTHKRPLPDKIRHILSDIISRNGVGIVRLIRA
jgi:hypothetical protein